MLIGTKQKPIKVFDFIGNFITSNEIKIRYTWFEYEGHSCIMTLKKALICENHLELSHYWECSWDNTTATRKMTNNEFEDMFVEHFSYRACYYGYQKEFHSVRLTKEEASAIFYNVVTRQLNEFVGSDIRFSKNINSYFIREL